MKGWTTYSHYSADEHRFPISRRPSPTPRGTSHTHFLNRLISCKSSPPGPRHRSPNHPWRAGSPETRSWTDYRMSGREESSFRQGCRVPPALILGPLFLLDGPSLWLFLILSSIYLSRETCLGFCVYRTTPYCRAGRAETRIEETLTSQLTIHRSVYWISIVVVSE